MFSSDDLVREPVPGPGRGPGPSIPGPNYPTQWALNPSAYQNLASDNVDWAALAQQWIMMKETAPPDHNNRSSKEAMNEGGEAPMDVENEKDDVDDHWSPSSSPTASTSTSWNWQQQQQQWNNWPANWSGPPGVAAPVASPGVGSLNKSGPLLPTPFAPYAASGVDPDNASDYTSFDATGTASSSDFNSINSGYWTTAGANRGGKYPIKSSRPFMKKGPSFVESTEVVTLDAAKRRQLPAWIREGLEKMEREKQKQQDREREKMEREEYLARKKEENENALELLRSENMGNTTVSIKSKFDSDSGDSQDEELPAKNNIDKQEQSKHRTSLQQKSPPIVLTEEDKMLMVRRAMTDVLLQVTSNEIETVCQEELNRFRVRTSAAASAKKGSRSAASGASAPAAGTLGLGMYGGDSSSDTDSDSDEANGTNNSGGNAGNNVDVESRINETSSGDKQHSQSKEKSKYTKSNPELPVRRISTEKNSGGDSQVDTTRSHGNVSRNQQQQQQQRRMSARHSSTSSTSSSKSSRSSSSSNSSTKSTSSSATESAKQKQEQKKKKSYSRNRSESQSGDEFSSGSRRKQSGKRTRNRSPASSSEKHRSKNGNNSGSSKKRRSFSVESDRRQRRERSQSRSRSRRRRSRSRDNNRRSRSRGRNNRRSRSRDRRSRSRNDYRSRSRDDRRSRRRSGSSARNRERHRTTYRSHRRTRSRSRSRSGGGKRTRGH